MNNIEFLRHQIIVQVMVNNEVYFFASKQSVERSLKFLTLIVRASEWNLSAGGQSRSPRNAVKKPKK